MPNPNVIEKFTVTRLKKPLNQPFRIATGQHDCLDNLIFKIKLSDGTTGVGEAAIATHITGETMAETKASLNKAGRKIIGESPYDYLKMSSWLNEELVKNKSAVGAVESALADALTKLLGMPLWHFFGDHCDQLSTDITIVIADLKETTQSVKKYYAQGFRIFKVKVGRDMDLDIKRVIAVKRLAPKSKIYLDANQGYSAEQTLQFVKELTKQKVKLSLIEQPTNKKDFEGLKKVSREAGVPVCADESASSLSDVVRIIKEKAAPVINIKLVKFGLFHAREAAQLAKANGIDLMIGEMMESNISSLMAAHLAAGIGGFKYIDLDTPFFVKEEVKKNPFLSRKGTYNLSKVKKGLGID
jgi:L-alanine-DL-glutamate epimerase-like enolase superfamily enzyme